MAVPLDQSPVLWLDADDTGTVTTSTGVATWADKSGLGNDFTQPFGGALEPAWVTSAINGRRAIDFDGSNDFLYRADDSDLYLTGDFSVFLVVMFDAVAKGGLAQNTIISRDYPKWEFFEYQGNLAGYINASSTGVGSATLTTATPYIIEWHRDGSNNVTASLNDTADLSTSISGDNTAAVGVNIGARPSGSSALYLNGKVGEILLFSSKLGTSDRDAVYSYLASRWLPVSTVDAETGTITLTGVDARPQLQASTGQITFTGVTAGIRPLAGTGQISVTGVDAFPQLQAGTGVVTVTGVDPSLIQTLTAETGQVTVTGVDIPAVLYAPTGAVTYTGVGATVQLQTGTGVITLTGVDVSIYVIPNSGRQRATLAPHPHAAELEEVSHQALLETVSHSVRLSPHPHEVNLKR